MRVLSPDACGATRRHQRIHACAECHGARVLKRHHQAIIRQLTDNILLFTISWIIASGLELHAGKC